MKFLLVLVCITFLHFFLGAQQLVMPGANPDPSVIKIGDTYWATATTSNWFPAFTLSYSKDLINWKQKGYIFYKAPEWASGYFWAPEISYDSGKVFLYYAAQKKNGGLCVAVASADKPEGPYTDHGPLVCQEDGSIDPFAIRDTSGKLFLIWKEDANSVGRSTPIWASEMNKERTSLIGEKRELFKNDAPWEKAVVEGVSMMRHGQYYYAFYAASGCCGSGCSYVTGVARAKDLLGPWEKYKKNPVLINSGNWICKGHGTPIEKNGRFYFLYHGYDKVTSAFTGREGLLQEFCFTPDDWIEFINTSVDSIRRNELFIDDFNENKLSQTWQWSIYQDVKYQLKDGQLLLSALPVISGSFLGHKIISADYTASAEVSVNQTTAYAGLAAIGDHNNIVAVLLKNNTINVLKIKNGNDTLITSVQIPAKDKVYLEMRVNHLYHISFFYSLNGKDTILLTPEPIRGSFLPPWDKPPRAGLISKGDASEKAVFDRFEIHAGAIIPPDHHKLQIFLKVLFILLVLSLGWFIVFNKKRKKTKEVMAVAHESI